MSNFFQLLLIITAIVVNVIAIKRNSYDNEYNLTCDNYILNTYLYLLSAFLIGSLILLVTSENENIQTLMIKIFDNLAFFIAYLVLLIVSFISLYSINPKNTILLHLVWLLIICMLSITMYFPIKLGNLANILKPAIAITIALVTITAYLGIYHGKSIVTFDWDKYLRYGIIVLILSYIVLPFVLGHENMEYAIYILSFVSLTIFTLLLLSYNKKLTERAEECHKENNPNYPKEALGLATKIINVLSDIIKILYMRKGKSSSLKKL